VIIGKRKIWRNYGDYLQQDALGMSVEVGGLAAAESK
jgi:hypothetical protein